MGIGTLLATTKLVEFLANGLSERNAGAGFASALPRISELAEGIGRLVEDKVFDLDGIDIEDMESDEKKKEVLDKLSTAITVFQNLFPERTTRGGFLDMETLKLLNRSTCAGERCARVLKMKGETADDISPFATKDPVMRYWMISYPSVPDAKGHFADACQLWSRQIRLDIREAESEAEANLVVFNHDIDGRGRDLADADKGPPRDRVMELRFDLLEDWSINKFLYASIHEMGHILGLGHTVTRNEIMFKQYQPDYFEFHKNNKNVLSDNDILRAQEIWGKPKKKT